MGKENAFDVKHLQPVRSKHLDFLEELDLPPQVLDFLQEKGRALLIGIICLILALLGFVFYRHHTLQRQEAASALLAQALDTPAGAQQTELYRKVDSQYGGTAAALWSRVQVAHAAQDAGKEKKAIAGYRAVLADLDAGNPLIPLLHYSLGQSYEAAGQPKEALSQYQQLAAIPGFAAQGLLAVARIDEAQHRTADAIEAYERLAGLKNQPLLDKGFVADKLASLRAQVSTKQEPK